MKQLIFILIGVLLLLFFAVYLLGGVRREKEFEKATEPTPNPTAVVRQKGLFIEAADPYNNEDNVPAGGSIIVTFSRMPAKDEFIFEISPAVEYDTRIEGKNLIVIPRSALAPGTNYNYKITFTASDASRSYDFRTLKQNEVLPDTIDPEVHDQQEEYELENATDVYVAGLTPFENNSFSVVSDYAYKPAGHYVFYVEARTDRENARLAFISWLKSNNLTDTQIGSLDILYR